MKTFINQIIAIIFNSIDELGEIETENSKTSNYKKVNTYQRMFKLVLAQKLISDNNINIQDLDNELITVELVKKYIERNKNLEDLNFNSKDIVLLEQEVKLKWFRCY